MLVEFASRGAASFEAELDRRAAVEQRARLALTGTTDLGGQYPTDDEASAAARTLRDE
jgi:hypothetical protein